MQIKKILIANRGEIACRVIKTARQMGIQTVAVYSSADASARHVRLADEAVAIGPAPAAESYLQPKKLLAAAAQTGADAIHPGYGFLSENEAFAQACKDAGVVFIGPPVSAIRAMGGKSAAKAIMGEAGVPLTPGYHGENQDPDFLLQQAEQIGWPVLIKASAGGGGKGMRLVENAEDFKASLASCQREAGASFNDDKVLVEKYITKPRHIEVQIFGDSHGQVVYLFERDCSVQRRHQKVLEEAPAPGMTPERRAAMGEAAVKAAQAVHYEGAGTVEFIANQDGSFYFMEMNTRLQVEHPVTEMITGLDLVEWQIRVAAGEPIPRQQTELTISGHAIEARIYAEDPERGFLPSTGKLHWLGLPAQSAQIRVDTGVESGDVISPFYDPMIAKLIVHDTDRARALARMNLALSQFHVLGVANNVPFLSRLVSSDSFVAPDLDTGLIERESDALFAPAAPVSDRALCIAALHRLLEERELARLATQTSQNTGTDAYSPWHLRDAWRLNLPARWRVSFDVAEELANVSVQITSAGFEFRLHDRVYQVVGHRLQGAGMRVAIDGYLSEVSVVERGGVVYIFDGPERFQVVRHDPVAMAEATEHSSGGLNSPMPGKIIAVKTEAGATVSKGDALLIMEAMKMEHTITAPADGIVATVNFSQGDQVEEGVELVTFERAT